jgi:hypothetical protein
MISVTPVAGFTGQVALSAVVTSGPNSAVDPPTLSFGTTTPVNISKANAETATLTISTTAAKSAALVRPMRPGSRWLAAETTISLCLLLFGFAGDRKRWRNLFGIASFLVITAGFAACGAGGGGGGLGNAGTTPGNYTITVTGSSGSLTQTTTLSLTVN